MLRSFFMFLLLLNLISCQDSDQSVVEISSPDRSQTLKSPETKKEPGIITGQVLNLFDDTAIKGAIVTIRKGSKIITTAITDANGFFKVIGLPQNIYHVTAEKNDFSAMTFNSISLHSGKEVVTHFILTPITRFEYVRLG